MFRCRAIDADGGHLIKTVQRPGAFGNRFAAVDVLSIPGAEADPAVHARMALQQAGNGQRFLQAGNRLAGQHVGLRFQQGGHARAVEFAQLVLIQRIVSPVLGTVGKESAVGPD